MTELASVSASRFITSTCQLIPRSSLDYFDHMHSFVATRDPAPTEYEILCGSNAEFYIQPLNNCIDDVDSLFARIDELAFSGDFPVLPSDMSGLADIVNCLKIEPDDRYPGFIRLQVWGEMNYNWKLKKYEFNPTSDTNKYAVLDLTIMASTYSLLKLRGGNTLNCICGPAVKRGSDEHAGLFIGFDFVRGVWCPQWPNEAQGWLNRPRINGWPTIDIISEVVQNGCHIVYIQHRSCRDDKLQWRFSFSLAERVLLQSWTQTQQIVYHLLRFLFKKELMQKDCPKKDEILCTYHLKTLMLWTCEEMPPEWWNSSSVITVCCELFKKLSEWLQKRECPNYFIPEANLFQDQSSSNIFGKIVGLRRLKKFCNIEIICHWFVENYILSFIHRHFQPVDKMLHFLYYMLPIFEYWNVSQFISLELFFNKTFLNIHESCRVTIKHGLSTGLRNCLKSKIECRSLKFKANKMLRNHPTIQNLSCFPYLDNLLYILHTAYGLDLGEISWDGNLFVEVINAISMQPKIIRSRYHNFPKAYTAQSCQYEFLRSQSLMVNLTGSNSRSESQLLALMTKQFLTKALKQDDAISDGIIPAALAYLAALHFATPEYQEAARLCSAVLVDKTPQADKETLNAGCLLFIDDVARIVGLCVLERVITKNSLHCINRRRYLDLRLSSDVFAHYLTVLSAERLFKQSHLYHDLPGSIFPMDANLKALIKPKCIYWIKSGSQYSPTRQIVYCRPDSLAEIIDDTNVNRSTIKGKVLDILMDYAVENMTSFYKRIRKDFGVQCNTIDSYHALYLYKCRQYDQVLHLCDRILKDPDLQKDLKEFSFANILLLPPLDSFFDRDVQSLLGFDTLFYCLSPLNDLVGEIELTVESTFEQWFAVALSGVIFQLSYILQNTDSTRFHYILGRHFLARYLKLRCYIDQNLKHSEALAEFAAHETNLPFEHIIRRFLLRKLRFWKQ